MGISVVATLLVAWLGHHFDPTFRWQLTPLLLVVPAAFCWVLSRDDRPLRITTTLDSSGVRDVATDPSQQGFGPRIIRTYALRWDDLASWRLVGIENGPAARYWIEFGAKFRLSFRLRQPAIFRVQLPTREVAEVACRFIASHVSTARRRADKRQLDFADPRMRVLSLFSVAWFALLAIPAIRDCLFPLDVLFPAPSHDSQAWQPVVLVLLMLLLGPGALWLLTVCPRRARNCEAAVLAVAANLLANVAGAVVLPGVLRAYALVISA